MRIPLDYYRILGLPIQATAEQLKQAHRDRTLQLPRREYSESAIEARKSLIDEAYSLLSDAEKRKVYDTQFFNRGHAVDVAVGTTKPADPGSNVGEQTLRAIASDAPPTPAATEPYTPKIDIDDTQFVGALLILLELGEYELVIRLGRPFLTGSNTGSENGRHGNAKPMLADIVLTLALACLELGREQWQQSQYENAAESLETGQELLLRENVFPGIRAELQSDLYKLRPYRILELVARPLEQAAERRQGIQLLKAMLHDRGGIDGAGDDLSGLSVDDFLRFIQQLRGYLAAGEQQEIFEGEARRPSAVATYLAVYALLARGFAFHQPALVRRAKQLLGRLSTQQDVHLEQAVCALLLGQAEEAGRALELSQEYEPLAFIREHSQNSPDLLPGLCLYAERWLREEVFSHFRDLAHQQTALKDYFANSEVQAYLESMPLAIETDPPASPEPTSASYTAFRQPAAFSQRATGPREAPPMEPLQSPLPSETPLGIPTAGHPETVVESDSGLSVAERVSRLSPEGQLQGRGTMPPAPQNGHRPSAAVAPPEEAPQGRRSRSPRWGRLAGVFMLGILVTGTVGVVTTRVLGRIIAAATNPTAKQFNTSPPVTIPRPYLLDAQIGTEDIAERAITRWLTAKQAALSEDYDIDALNTVLVDPALTERRNQASAEQLSNIYYVYEHAVEILNVEPNDPSAEAITVEAQVSERADAYQLGEPIDSYDSMLTMQYDLVQQEGEWFVQNMTRLD
ncbi:MAG: IMS domain-containing protein [Cyanobacteria bacterium P01_D01_bin.115]